MDRKPAKITMEFETGMTVIYTGQDLESWWSVYTEGITILQTRVLEEIKRKSEAIANKGRSWLGTGIGETPQQQEAPTMASLKDVIEDKT